MDYSQAKIGFIGFGNMAGAICDGLLLKDAVCTPGGTTIVGVEALEEKGFRHAVMHAVDKIMEKKHSM